MTSSDPTVDRLALRELSDRYASAVDRRDVGSFVELFTDDAELSVHDPAAAEAPSRVRSGRGELSEVPRLVARYPKTFHFVGNCLYEIDGDAASGEVYCMARHLIDDPEAVTARVMVIRYLDDYQRGHDGRWRISRRRVLVDWTETHQAAE
jgi:ketosteroid isomerase-like protein